MDTSFGALADKSPTFNPSSPPAPPRIRDGSTDEALRGDYAISSWLRRDDMFQLEMQERIRWEVEKEEIRKEIIASQIARRRMIGAEVRMEMMLERESALRRDIRYFNFPAVAPSSRDAVQLDSRAAGSQQHTGYMLEERPGWSEERTSLQQQGEMNNITFQRTPVRFTREDAHRSMERNHFMSRREMGNFTNQRTRPHFTGEEPRSRSEERNPFQYRREMDNLNYHRTPLLFTREDTQRSDERNPFQCGRELDKFTFQRTPHKSTVEAAQRSDKRNPFQYRREVDDFTSRRKPLQFTGEDTHRFEERNHIQPTRDMDTCIVQRSPLQFTRVGAHKSVERTPIQNQREAGNFTFQRTQNQFNREVAHTSKATKEKMSPLINPSITISGTKRKAVAPPTGLSEIHLAVINKKPKEDWSCALCQVSLSTKQALDEHLEQNEHKKLAAELIAKRVLKEKEAEAKKMAKAASKEAVIKKQMTSPLQGKKQNMRLKKPGSDGVRVAREKDKMVMQLNPAFKGNGAKVAKENDQLKGSDDIVKNVSAKRNYKMAENADAVRVAKENNKMMENGVAVVDVLVNERDKMKENGDVLVNVLPPSSLLRLSHKKITGYGDAVVGQLMSPFTTIGMAKEEESRPTAKQNCHATNRKIKAETKRQELIQRQLRGEDLRLWCEACNVFSHPEHAMAIHLQGKRHKARVRELGITQTISTAPILMPYMPLLSKEIRVSKAKEKRKKNGGAVLDVLAQEEEKMEENVDEAVDVPAQEEKIKENFDALTNAQAKGEQQMMENGNAIVDVPAKGEQKMKEDGNALVDIQAKKEDEKMEESVDALVDVHVQGEGKAKQNGNSLVALPASLLL